MNQCANDFQRYYIFRINLVKIIEMIGGIKKYVHTEAVFISFAV